MFKTSHLRSVLVVGASAAALTAIGAPAAAQQAASGGTVIQELVVTAQRREEALQDVPVAVSAFSTENLRAQRLDGGQNLLQAVPNVNFSRGQFGGFNFSIRGIGTKVVGGSGEAGVSFHENNSPLTSNRLADAEFYDVDRVEVLRGPQGTLYGRNATGGVVNVITAKPGEDFGGFVQGDYGNYDTRRLKGAVNIPINDAMSLRWAGFYLKRDGFGENTYTHTDIDDRDITSSRLSFRVHPQDDKFDVTAMWEHFNEKDKRSRIGKMLCVPDPGPASVLGVPVPAASRGLLSQGCVPGSLYSDAAYGAPNSVASLGGLLTQLAGLSQGDLFAGKVQDHDLRNIESVRDPIYQGQEDFFQIDAAFHLNDTLTLNSLTSFNYNDGYSYQDYTRALPTRAFTPAGALAALFPGGVVNDPQVGASNLLRQFDMGTLDSKEFTQEVRLSSSSNGPLNFSLGGIHIEYSSLTDYYVFSNGLTAYAQLQDILAGRPGVFPFYVDPGFPPRAGEGHNYYDSRARNQVNSNAVFGEIYYNLTDTLKITAGLRYTQDKKRSDYLPITLLANPLRVAPPPGSGVIPNPTFNGGRGFPEATRLRRKDDATTGRLNIQWSPDLAFSDQSMFYATYSRGYKGGGFNTPCDNQSPGCGLVNGTYDPEYVNSYEVGTKNVLMGGRMVLNLTGFYYDYQGYQISKIVNKSATNENVDATIKGLELESIWEPVHNLRFNLNAGYLKTRLKGGSSIDPLNRTQGNPNLMVVKATDASNCVVTRQGVAALLTVAPAALPLVCNLGSPSPAVPPAVLQSLGLYNYTGITGLVTSPIFANNAPGPNSVVNVGQGIPVQLKGNKLPNSPEWTLSVGAQYTWNLSGGWNVVARGDYYRQADSYARIFNSVADKLKGYHNVNATLTLASDDKGVEVQLYGKNITNETPITDIYLNDDSTGLYTNTFTLEPREYGISIRKTF